MMKEKGKVEAHAVDTIAPIFTALVRIALASHTSIHFTDELTLTVSLCVDYECLAAAHPSMHSHEC